MATHDYVISNASGAAVRADLNNALAAIVSNNSNATAPSTTYAYQWWADTTNGVMKLRNAANTDWITLYQLDGEFTNIKLENGTAAAPSLYFKDSGTDTGLYSPGADQVAISTGGTARLYVGSDGKVGVGTTTFSSVSGLSGAKLQVTSGAIFGNDGASSNGSGWIAFDSACTAPATTKPLIYHRQGVGLGFLTDSAISFEQGATERARIDSSGRLLVGTSSARSNFFNSTVTAAVQIEGTTGDTAALAVIADRNGAPPRLILASSGGGTIGSNTAVASGNGAGAISFQASDGTEFVQLAEITADVDATPGANDMPGRLVFSTTADNASSPTERGRINSSGATKFTTSASYRGSSTAYHEFTQGNQSDICLVTYASHASYNSEVQRIQTARSASSLFSFLLCDNNVNVAGDTEFNLRGDGQAYADGSWNGGGADYAEYFEWSDCNSDAEDRRGISVVLDGDKIREAVAGEDPIGVISGNPSVVGDAAWNKWSGKYLRDEFGTYILEDYEVENEDGNTVVQQRRKLNPAYDPDQEYIPREQRPEWDCVGLMGKLRIRKGQVTGSRWIKMRDISDSVEEWLVR